MGEKIIIFVCACYFAMFMFGIGFFQRGCKKPVGFSSGEKEPDISDITAWNKKHGNM